MAYIPQPMPLMPGDSAICMEIIYEKQFTTVDDVWHDTDHLHDCYEIYVNLSGDVSFRVTDQVYSISRGDVILTGPNALHRCLYHSDCVHEHFCLWIKGVPLSETNALQFPQQPLISLSPEHKSALIDHCFGLYRAQQAEESQHFRAAHHFFGILDLICTGEHEDAVARNLPLRFTEILLHISRHFREPSFNVTAICETFFISNSSLNRYFSTYFQTSPSLYIESCRFAEAKKLLQTGHSVQDTGLRCGFSDCPYFVKRFRKKFGITPLRYQKQCDADTERSAFP